MNIIEDFQNEINKVIKATDLSYYSEDQRSWLEQAISAPYYNSKAVLDFNKLPENLSAEELYKVWVSALNELTIYTFLTREFLYGSLRR